MDTAQLTILIVNMVGFATILLALFTAMLLSHTLYKRLDAKMETPFRRLSGVLDERYRRPPAKLYESYRRLESKTDPHRVDTQSIVARPSEAELEQARLDGVNSVLASQTHSHESPGN